MEDIYTPGPNNSSIDGVTVPYSLPLPILDFKRDFRVIEEEVGMWKVTDLTSPMTQPSTVRIAQRVRPNIYAGTSVDPSSFLSNKEGLDTVIEIFEVGEASSSTDPTASKLVPVRVALSFTMPTTAAFEPADLERLFARVVAFAYAQRNAAGTGDKDGITALQHRVLAKW